MKSKTKRVIVFFVVTIFILFASGFIWISLPYVKIRKLNERYLTITKGMSQSEVISIMKEKHFVHNRTKARWDYDYLGTEEDARVCSAIGFGVRTFYLPVVFEFTFDKNGKLVGRYRND